MSIGFQKLKSFITLVIAAALITVSFGFSDVLALSPVRGNYDGSAGGIEGRTVVITIFADELNYQWDFTRREDINRRYTVNRYLRMAGTYIEQQTRLYGVESEFITDFSAHPDLTYHIKTDTDFASEYGFNHYYLWDPVIWDSIDQYIDVEGIKTRYDADNVVFLTVFNTDEACESISCTRNWYEGMESDYEIVYLFYVDLGQVNPPSVYAHEILHTFGAPDLYQADRYFGITEETVHAYEADYSNDIMLTCSDPVTYSYVYDRISNDLTGVTAYYLHLR